MSFTVQKSLGNSFFRFAVGRRRDFASLDADRELSTGPTGEFIRHRPEIFYSADLRAIRSPEVPAPRSIGGTPFWSSVFEKNSRGKLMMGLMAFGGLLILWGLALLAQDRPGWVLLILGLILVSIPIVITGQKRRAIKLHEAQVRREREERDARNRELLGAYTSSLERLREDPSDENLRMVKRENEKLDLPYSLWADVAIGTVLHVGFSALARLGAEKAADVANLMDRASEAAGLIDEDTIAVKHALYSTILWHFLADDRLGEEQLKIVRAVQQGFGIDAEDVPIDTSAEAQFDRLRGIDHRRPPRCEASVPMKLNEYCLYTSPVKVSEATHNLFVTNKRIIVDGAKPIEADVPAIDDIIADADRNRVVIRAAGLKSALEIHAEEPIYLAAMADLATRLDDRPKSFT